MILSVWVFSRWMALIYLIAFWSLGAQVLGLIGSHGILPLSDFLHYVRQQEGANSFWTAPTLCWFNGSDGFLLFLCGGGVALSILLFMGVMPGLTAFLLWMFYLSLTVGAQDFLGFQWDNLLLEAGFLLIFLLPQPFRINLKPSARPSAIVIWLLRWLLFRLIFESGIVKLVSGDFNWSHLTALTYHYWTQPLPNVISWYANQLPLWFQKLSCALLLLIEIVVPFFIFGGRWGRLIAFFGITGLQLLIILTGNYCFFNLLAIGLCMTLLEDEHYKKILSFPNALVGNLEIRAARVFYKTISSFLAAFILISSLGMMADSFAHISLPRPIEDLLVAISPMRSVNNYGLFAVMTTQRDEIILEGSRDGEHWLPYEFRYKPGNVRQAPRWAMPHQPRLDWQMWFAALGTWRENQWVLALMERLLQGEPAVTRLLADNPFAGHPPRYIEATVWEYHFTDFKTRAQTGDWWSREFKGLYCPIVSLKGGS